MKLTRFKLEEVIQQELKTIILERQGGAPSLAHAARARGRIVPGHRGPQVVDVQQRVGAKPDGIYGRNTRAKVAAFQERCGIYVDGVVGEDTATVLLDPRRCGKVAGAAEEEPKPGAPGAAEAKPEMVPTLTAEQLDWAAELGDHLEDAMDGMGTDEDKIWWVIKQATADPGMMGAVVEYWEKTHGHNWTDGDLEGAFGEEIENQKTRHRMLTIISRALGRVGPQGPSWYEGAGELGALPHAAGGAYAGSLAGAQAGAALGSIVPGIGTGIGALGGAALGGLGGYYGGKWIGTDQRSPQSHRGAYRRKRTKKAPPTK